MEDKIIEKELSYKLGSIFFEIQGELGRFCRERQYADLLEKKLEKAKIKFKREYPIEIANRKSNFVDFIIEDKMLVGLNRSSGQVLIEAMVAISIVTVGLLGIFSVLSRSLSLNRTVADNYVAANLAAEGIEIVKNIVDGNVLKIQNSTMVPWNLGVTNGVYVVNYNDNSLSSSILENCDADSIKNNASFAMTFNSDNGLYTHDTANQDIGISATNFKRVVCVDTSDDGNEIKVNSIVTWTGRGGAEFDINLEDHFYNWTPTECNDGIDNDDDKKTDYKEDPECNNLPDKNSELPKNISTP